MSNSNIRSLRAAFSSNYEHLARRLSRRLGSADLALEALHEAFIRIDRVSDSVVVQSPLDYIFRAAINVAKDRKKSDSRLLRSAEIAAIVDVPDDRPDAFAVVSDRADLNEFDKVLSELSDRRRRVFLAAHVEQIPHEEIARRFGVNVRTIAFDLQYAMQHLALRLGRKVPRRGDRKTL